MTRTQHPLHALGDLEVNSWSAHHDCDTGQGTPVDQCILEPRVGSDVDPDGLAELVLRKCILKNLLEHQLPEYASSHKSSVSTAMSRGPRPSRTECTHFH